MNLRRLRQQGLTMIELLIIIVIVAMLLMIFMFAGRLQINRARDANRKTDLDRIKIAFEDYYNDNNCYPAPDILETCESSALEPYMDKVPCDPGSRDPYLYVPNLANQCSGYRLFAQLNDPNDPKIDAVGCGGVNECGVGPGFNYGVSVGMALVENPGVGGEEEGGEGSSETPPPSNFQGPWACAPDGACNHYGSIQAAYDADCPFSFAETDCQNRCGNPAFICVR